MITGFSIVNGDCLAQSLEPYLSSEKFLVFRECLVEHNGVPYDSSTFWDSRRRFMVERYQITSSEYQEKTIKEYEKIQSISLEEPIYLWFEYDLFCQINFWFLVHDLSSRGFKHLFWVQPTDPTGWTGFGNSSALDLLQAWKNAAPITPEWIQTGSNLWISYQNQDWPLFEKTFNHPTNWPKLTEIGKAQLDRLDLPLGRPLRILQSLRAEGITDFPTLFRQFQLQAGEYGLGDTQVLHLLKELDSK